MTQARFYGIGMGPGDPELLTLKAIKMLQTLPVISWPGPPKGESIARRIAEPYLRTRSVFEIPLRMQLDAQNFPDNRVYDETARKIQAQLQKGRDVGFLCEGDPLIHGSFLYLYARLVRIFPVSILSGISSIAAAAAQWGMPLAAKDDRIAIVPATAQNEKLKNAIAHAETVLILKIGCHLARIKQLLDEMQLTQCARYIEYACWEQEYKTPLEHYAKPCAPYFSLILVQKAHAHAQIGVPTLEPSLSQAPSQTPSQTPDNE